jgi:hypothetical protein
LVLKKDNMQIAIVSHPGMTVLDVMTIRRATVYAGSPLSLDEFRTGLTIWIEGYNIVMAYGIRVSNTVSGYTTPQPQHSAPGRLTNEEHYMTLSRNRLRSAA